MEAYEKMLDTWMDLVTNMKDLPVEILYPQSREVFNTYVQCHISAPEGSRIQVNGPKTRSSLNRKKRGDHSTVALD